MKKNKFLIVFAICLFLINIKVNAYKCVYDVTYPENWSGGSPVKEKISFIVDTKKNDITFSREKKSAWEINEGDTIYLDEYIDKTKTKKKIIELMDGNCYRGIYICRFIQWTSGSDKSYLFAALFYGSLYSKIPSEKYDITYNNIPFRLPEKKTGCITGNANDSESTAPIIQNNTPCDFYKDIMEGTKEEEGMKQLYCIGKSNCSSDNMQKYNRKKEELKKYCSEVLSFSDYGANPCASSCLNISNDIAAIEGDSSKNSTCGFSDKLLVIINNILRWIKYILPAIVIILGILDFLKAISSDKEEEMKKAQKRFIIRLVAAALVFIVPLILTFILEKMGFGVNDCGIDLFK